MGLCSSKRCSKKTKRNTRTQKKQTANNSTSSICPWQPYQSRSTLRDSFYIPLSQNHINICDVPKSEQSDESIMVHIPLSVECKINPLFADHFAISAPHSADYSIQSLLKDILDSINEKHDAHIKYQDLVIKKSSFCRERTEQSTLKDYHRQDIEQYGLQLQIRCAPCIHHPCCNRITCPNMTLNNTFNPRICPVYENLMNEAKLDDIHDVDYIHFTQYNHLKDAFAEKVMCKSYDECVSFKAQQSGSFENLMQHRLHLSLYKHPPRRARQVKLQQNIHPFIESKHVHHRYHYLYTKRTTPSPSISPENNGQTVYRSHFRSDGKDDYLTELMQELIQNGFSVLLSNSMDNIIRLVKEKMNCIRHTQMWSPLNSAEMCALMLYVNCDDIAYDISHCQLCGKYSKWKVLDRCLYDALHKLNEGERGDYKLYMAASNLQITQRVNKHGYFPTYFSATWKKENVIMADQSGVMIEMHNSFRKHHICADVSWLSLFPDECEVLLARDIPMDDRFYSYTLKLQNEVNSVQHAHAYFVPHHL